VVRWYVEGDTEYHAILAVLPEPDRFHIELINLKGNLKGGRDNIALKLSEWLDQDRKLRRFSFFSLDADVPDNLKFLSRQVQHNRIVGYIALHRPDFEFANFDREELVEIAARLDERLGFAGAPVRAANWNDVVSARQFEDRYRAVSQRHQSLKGAEWGKALSEYACEKPSRKTSERLFWRQIEMVMMSRTYDYAFQEREFLFDPETLELSRRNHS
jgi:hypothetical protein